jgi:hydrogenase-4 component E
MIRELNDLTAGLFLISGFAILRFRQVQDCFRSFLFQSFFLAVSAFLIGFKLDSLDLMIAAGITILSKLILIPWTLNRSLHQEMYERREIAQILNLPVSLLIGAGLLIFSYFISMPILRHLSEFSKVNLPIGIAGALIGAYTLIVRQEAIPQLIGILAMENGGFFLGISTAANLPLMAELIAAFDVLILAFVAGILIHHIHQKTGTTHVGSLNALKEGTGKP